MSLRGRAAPEAISSQPPPSLPPLGGRRQTLHPQRGRGWGWGHVFTAEDAVEEPRKDAKGTNNKKPSAPSVPFAFESSAPCRRPSCQHGPSLLYLTHLFG